MHPTRPGYLGIYNERHNQGEYIPHEEYDMEEPYTTYEEDYRHPMETHHYYDKHYHQRETLYEDSPQHERVRPVVEEYSDYDMDVSEAVGAHEYQTRSESKTLTQAQRQAKIEQDQR
jgi:hypothetical protein